ncbi:PLDc N-terminal domain-containing protein [Paenibacillus silvestris]|uniref:PLDc N-terminal domain-containing protein n=1 Tax=Paenibacillus silvestris TaxID=2606219 RepID=UPI0038B28D80
MSSNASFALGSGFILFFIFISFALFLAHIVLCVWAYRDCVRRGKSTEFAIIVLLVMLFFPLIGLIVYLIIRND